MVVLVAPTGAVWVLDGAQNDAHAVPPIARQKAGLASNGICHAAIAPLTYHLRNGEAVLGWFGSVRVCGTPALWTEVHHTPDRRCFVELIQSLACGGARQ